jgi:membrane-bound serine protease (ClpP class)
MEDKILNDTLAWIETIAKNRGRNADWAKRAVFESASATEKEALEKKIVELIATDINDLLAKLDGRAVPLAEKTVTLKTRNARLVTKDLSLRQTILDTIAHPNIAYGLLMLGVLGLFIEVTHPGVIFPGVLGVICIVVALYSFAMLPVNFAGFLLLGLGILFFIAEALTPMTFGLLTLAGAVAMLIGSLLLIDSPFAFMRVSLNVILPFVLAVASVILFLVTRVLKAHRQKAATGPSTLVGRLAVAQADFKEEGQVFLEGELWTALNKGPSPVRKGEKVRVLEVDKVKLIVSK